MTQWKLRRRGRTVGPLPTSELLRALQLGKVPIDSEAQRDGEDEWAALADFPEFAEEIARDTPTHIMSAPWFLESGNTHEHSKAGDTDPTDVLLEATPLPVPAVMTKEAIARAEWPPIGEEEGSTLEDAPRDQMPTIAMVFQSSVPPTQRESGDSERSPGFSRSDAEPVTPRVKHPVVPPAAVPPAHEIPQRRSAVPGAASVQQSDSEQERQSAEPPVASATPLDGIVAPKSDDASMLAAMLESSSPAQLPTRSDDASLLATMLESTSSGLSSANSVERGTSQEERIQSSPGAPELGSPITLSDSHDPSKRHRVPPRLGPEPGIVPAPSSLTPLPIPPTEETFIEELEEVEPAEYDSAPRQDAVSDSDASSAPPLVLQAVNAPLGPDSMNRVESHGPAPLPSPETRGVLTHQETTSPTVRVYTPENARGRRILWSLILLLAVALIAATYAILTRR